MLQTCCCLTAVTAFLPARLVISILTERIDRQRRKFDWTAKSGRVTASWPVLFPSVILMYDDHQLCVVVGHVGIGASRNGFTRPPTSRVLGFRLFSYSSGAEPGENERDFIMADKLNGGKKLAYFKRCNRIVGGRIGCFTAGCAVSSTGAELSSRRGVSIYANVYC